MKRCRLYIGWLNGLLIFFAGRAVAQNPLVRDQFSADPSAGDAGQGAVGCRGGDTGPSGRV